MLPICATAPFNRTLFPKRKENWAIAGLAILGSILLHGVTSTPPHGVG
jgi:uncharacterized membrane protein YcfT